MAVPSSPISVTYPCDFADRRIRPKRDAACAPTQLSIDCVARDRRGWRLGRDRSNPTGDSGTPPRDIMGPPLSAGRIGEQWHRRDHQDDSTLFRTPDTGTDRLAARCSLLAALDERSVRIVGLRVEDAAWRPDQSEWRLLRDEVVKRDGNRCAVPGCDDQDDLHLDHIWRGSLLAAAGWSPSAINDPINLQLLCPSHHASKTTQEAQLLKATNDLLSADE